MGMLYSFVFENDLTLVDAPISESVECFVTV